MEKLSFKLEIFEGPLDLLMHLIRKNKVNIYDIPISEITDQYLEYLDQISKMDLEISSEFLVMAAQLLYIKSKMLLPQYSEEEQEEDPRKELVDRLLEYKRYQEVAMYLGERESQYRDIFFKSPGKIEHFESGHQFINISIEELTKAFQNLLLKQDRRLPPNKETFDGIIKREIIPVDLKMQQIMSILKKHKQINFLDLFKNSVSKAEIVAKFLGVLELIRVHKVRVIQNTIDKTMYIQRIEDGEVNGN